MQLSRKRHKPDFSLQMSQLAFTSSVIPLLPIKVAARQVDISGDCELFCFFIHREILTL